MIIDRTKYAARIFVFHASGRNAGINAVFSDRTKRAVRVFVFRDLSRKLLPHAFRRASGRKAGINAISYDIKKASITGRLNEPKLSIRNYNHILCFLSPVSIIMLIVSFFLS